MRKPVPIPKSRKKPTYKEICAPSIRQEYAELFEKNFNVKPSQSFKKDLGIIKRLILEQGKDVARELVLESVTNWEMLKTRIPKLHGFPTIPAIYGFRFSFIDLLKEPRKNSVEYSSVEYDGFKISKKNNKKVSISKLFAIK